MLRDNRGQILTLIEILVVVVIIVAVGLVLARGYLGGNGSEDSGHVSPVQHAQGVECMNNLQQIRHAISIYQQTDERSPASLADLQFSGIGEQMRKCPVAGTPYNYDSASGRVWCTVQGHERY